MALLGSRLNSARYTSILADLNTQFGAIPSGLLAGEQALITAGRSKLAHAIADNEGTDVVTEITTNAAVVVTSVSGVTPGVGTSGPGTGTVT